MLPFSVQSYPLKFAICLFKTFFSCSDYEAVKKPRFILFLFTCSTPLFWFSEWFSDLILAVGHLKRLRIH